MCSTSTLEKRNILHIAVRAAMMASIASVSSFPIAAHAQDLVVDGGAEQTITTVETFGNVVVGETGAGTLNIEDGGALNNSEGFVGDVAGSTGTVSVTGTGSWANSGVLVVGFFGAGTLDIKNGGTVSAFDSRIGSESGSTGTVAVTGTGSSWTLEETFVVGGFGDGTMIVADGGSVSNNRAVIGGATSSSGAVTVAGADSSWTNSGSLGVGLNGTGTLNITDGGVVSNTVASIGDGTGSTGTVTVSGTGSSWTSSNAFRVGANGSGTLNIENGGTVSNVSSSSIVGDNSTSTGTVTVTGAGSSWTNTGDLLVGRAGTGTLDVLNGAAVSVGDEFVLGFDPGGTGTATVSGSGSTLQANRVTVGDIGTSGVLNIENGGSLSNFNSIIGGNSGVTGAVTVAGVGSSWTSAGSLVVGSSGNGTLTIENGGSLSNVNNGIIGNSSSSTGAVTVTGAGSSWTNAGDLIVGLSGAGTLTLADGGLVRATSGAGTVDIANVAGATGTFNIGAAAGDVAVAAGALDGVTTVSFGVGAGALSFNHTETDYAFDAAISGAGTLDHLAGVTNLTADSSGFSGDTNITGGTVRITATSGGSPLGSGLVTVTGAGTLAGNGNVPMTGVESGGRLDPAPELHFTDNLSLEPGARIALALELPGQLPGSGVANDYIHVQGDLVLDGSIEVQAGPLFTAGSYPVIEVAGAISDNGVLVNNLPSGYTATVNTASPPWIELDVARLSGFHAVGGQISGLDGASGPTLRNNGGDDLPLNGNGGFAFSALIADGGSYNVTVAQQPSNTVCAVADGSGVVAGADISNVQVQCAAAQATLAPDTLVFRMFEIGDPSISRVAVLENTGTVGIPVNAASIIGIDASDFEVGIDECTAQVLAPGALCGVEVLFDPASAAGSALRVATLRIDTAVSTVPASLAVDLQGFIDSLMRDGFESPPTP